jgi:hypothetical protein
MPMSNMIVSPNHRILLNGPQITVNFDEDEVLVAAKHLVGMHCVEKVTPRNVSYLHLLCARHEVLMVDANWTESFQPGAYTMTGMASDQVDEVYSLFPELKDPKPTSCSATRALCRAVTKHKLHVRHWDLKYGPRFGFWPKSFSQNALKLAPKPQKRPAVKGGPFR